MDTTHRRHFHHEMIQKPGPRLLMRIPLNFVQKHAFGGSARGTNASLNLTSFIDFLVVIVVFLLMSFSASGENGISKNVRIPHAENTLAMIDLPIISVSPNIMVDGIPAGSARQIEEAGRVIRVEELLAVLKNKREAWKQIYPEKPFPGAVLMQVDQRVPALIVKSVFLTATQAGYPNVSFMVNQMSSRRAATANISSVQSLR